MDQQPKSLPTPQDSALLAYRLLTEKTNILPLGSKDKYKGIAIARLSEMAMVPVQTALRSHYRSCDVRTMLESR